MKKKRLIPVLLLKNGWLVQSKSFSTYQNLGNPTTAVTRISEWGSDELIYLDISSDNNYDIRRDDQNYPNRKTFLEIIEDVSSATFMPITVGGKIKSLNDIENRLRLGADKISINQYALKNPAFIEEAAKEFGSQCIVISIDVKKHKGDDLIYNYDYKNCYDLVLLDYLKMVEDLGAGEILVNSVDRDGSGEGYDIGLLNDICENIKIPIIACGGVGEWSHFQEALEKTNVDAVSAANIFHYIDQSVYLAKSFLFDNGLNVRKPDLLTIK